ncbi:MAG: serine protease AprX [Actinomycetota bacterium]|nr:serine protease AprX [Actinomycetota bacterium]
MTQTAVRRGAAARLGIALAAALALLTAGAPALSRPAARPSGQPVSVLVRAVAPTSGVAERIVKAVGGTVTEELPIVGGFAAKVPAGAVQVLRSVPGAIKDVTDAGKIHFEGSYGQNSGIASAIYPTVVGADKAWRAGWTGSGIGIAVIDTGINATGDLAGKVVHSEDFSGDNDNYDHFGHGTFIGGLIAGSGAASNGTVKGVAPDANLIALKIASSNGSADITHVIAALQWAVSFKADYNIKVINLSLGTDSTQDYRVDPLNYAVEKAWQAGITVVVSASNRGPAAGTISKPADDPYVVTVGAVRDNTTLNTNDDTVAEFSGAGPTAANGLVKPDIAAPGGSVVSTRVAGSSIDNAFPAARIGSAYFKGSGTSFASAITSGAAALVLSRNPLLSPDQVKARLTSTARPGPVNDPNRVGAGVLDAYAATASNSLAAANQGLTPSSGLGSLQASRGSTGIKIQTGIIEDGAGNVMPVLVDVLGETTAQGLPFDRVGFYGAWTSSSWYSSSWYSSSWYSSSWYSSSWYANNWE